MVADHVGGEGRAVFATLGAAQVDGGVAGVVIDGDVGICPAGMRVSLHAVLENAFATICASASADNRCGHRFAIGGRSRNPAQPSW